MTEWQWVQIGILLGQVTVFGTAVWAITRDLKELRREHYDHREKVAEKYATKEEVDKILKRLESMRVEIQSMLLKLLEEVKNERKG